MRVRRVFTLVLKDSSKAVEFMRRLAELEYEMEAEMRGTHVTIGIKGSKEEIKRAREEIGEMLRLCEGGEG
ncbi:MAG: hypothetical protein QXM46_01210 [Candidatus Hadarchaeales archaeon]